MRDVSALSLRGNGDHIDVFVTGWSETGLSRFRIDLGPLAPTQTASAAGGVLTGGAGSDLLMGGAGPALWRGGR